MPIARHLIAAAIAASVAAAQQQPSSIAARVAAAPADGVVEMRFPARAGVCGDGSHYISVGRGTITGDVYRNGEIATHGACVPGPVRVVLTLRGHDVSRIRAYVGGDSSARPSARSSSSASTLDLGAVDPAEAAAYLLDVARRADGRAADDAILPAVLADRAVVWPALLAIARDSGGGNRSRGTRGTAGFWLSRFAAAARDGHPERIAETTDADDGGDDGGDDVGVGKKADVRGQAVFALSQLPRHEGVPSLIQVARTHRDPSVRHKALFWLGQSDDPRAFALFEEILRGK